MKYEPCEIIKMDSNQLRMAIAEAQGFSNAYVDKNLGWCGFTSVGDRYIIPDPVNDITDAMRLIHAETVTIAICRAWLLWKSYDQ